jgi:hypothetical protein
MIKTKKATFQWSGEYDAFGHKIPEIKEAKMTKPKTILDVLKPTEKTYVIGGVEYIAITDFIKNRLSIKCRNKTILNETLDNYTNSDGLNMEGYVKMMVGGINH